MPEFIVRAHAAPVDPILFLGPEGREAHVEYLVQILLNTLFVSKGHRPDTTLTLVLESSRDFSCAVSLAGESLGDFGGLSEAAVLGVIAEALALGEGLSKEASLVSDRGIKVSRTSFEHLVKARLAQGDVYLLDRKGSDVRDVELADTAVFLLTDHVPLPKKLQKSILRQGVVPISLGPVMLQASQCVVLVQNEYDRYG